MNKNRNNFKKRKYNVSRTVGISMNTMLVRENLTGLHTGAVISVKLYKILFNLARSDWLLMET